MRTRLKISRAGIELIKSFEGLRRKAARLPDGRWTIGYGHTLSAREGAEVSAEDAEALLLFDLLPVAEAVNGLAFVELTQNQFDALCAFAFNVGVEAFRGSDVLKRVNEGRLTEAACAFDLWRKADIAGEEMVLDALIRRRAAEKALFLTPTDGFVPTPTPLVRPAEDPAMAATLPRRRPAQIEAPLEGDEAVVRRVGPVEEPEPEHEATQLEPEPAPAAEPIAADEMPVEQELAAVERTEPGAEAMTAAAAEAGVVLVGETLAAEVEPEAPAEPAPVIEAFPLRDPAVDRELSALLSEEPGAEAIAEAQAPAAVEPAAPPPAEPEAAAPEPAPEPFQPANETQPSPAPEPAPAAVTVAAAAAMSARLFSPYGGGVSFGALPPRARLVEVAPPTAAPEAAPAAVQPEPVQAPPPEPQAPPAVEQPVAGSAALELEPPARPEPAVNGQSDPELQPFTLTPPPEREPAFMPQSASVVWSQPHAETGDTDETPLFEETWEEVRPAPRIIRHEPVETGLGDEEAGPNGPFIVLGVIGLAAFGGAVAAFLKAKQVATVEPVVLAWALALIAVACVSTSVYFLLKRLGGVHD